MELTDAIKIVKALAQGINPIQGEKIAADAPYNHPDVIRALFVLLEQIPSPKRTPLERQQDNVAQGLPRNTGMPWSDEMRKSVAIQFKAGSTIDQLAKSQERTKSAIVAELVRQQIISNDQAGPLLGGNYRFAARSN